MSPAPLYKCPLQVPDPGVDPVERLAYPKLQVGNNLVIAATPGMQFATDIAPALWTPHRPARPEKSRQSTQASDFTSEMATKDVRFSVDARDRILRGVDILAAAPTRYTIA